MSAPLRGEALGAQVVERGRQRERLRIELHMQQRRPAGRRSAAAELRMPTGTEVTLRAPGDGDDPPPSSQPVTFTPRSTP